MLRRGVRLLTTLVFLAGAAQAHALNLADYYTVFPGRTWTATNYDNPSETYDMWVSDIYQHNGHPAVRYHFEGQADEFDICYDDGSSLTWYGVFDNGDSIDIEPDVAVGEFSDGDTLGFYVDGSLAAVMMLRYWSELDAACQDSFAYAIPGSATGPLVLMVSYDLWRPRNVFNECIESGLPPGATPPNYGVTVVGWYESCRRTVPGGQVLKWDIHSDGSLGVKYQIQSTTPVASASWGLVKALYR